MTTRKSRNGLPKTEEYEYRLVVGTVDKKKDHIGIWYGDDENLIALIAHGSDKTFIIQYLIAPDLFDEKKRAILQQVQEEINFFLIEKGEEKPWSYACYHCGSVANLYGPVHWGFFNGNKDK